MPKGRLSSILFGIGLVLIVPLICFFILKKNGHTGHVPMPAYYGIDTIIQRTKDGEKIQDTNFHQIAGASFFSHLNDTIQLDKDYEGKVLIMNFFFTTCTTICPKISYHMQRLQSGFKKKMNEIQLVSFSVDPKTDDVPTLRQYANKYTEDHDTWTFLTGKKKDIYDFARKELFLELPAGSGGADDFIHPNEIILIDKYRNIRGYYNGLDSMEVLKCIEDVSHILVEKNKRHKED